MNLFGLIIPLLAFLFESYPRLLNRKFGVDVWTHLLYLKEYHKQKGIPKEIKNGFIVSGTYDYPPAFIVILSKFPFRLVEKFEFFFSPFFDAIHLTLIYILVFQMTGNILLALLTQLIYMLTPIIVLENSSATPRSLGYLLFTVTFMLLFSYLQLHTVWFLVLAVITGSLIFLSHRFTTQGFFFYSLFFTFFDRTFLYIGIFCMSFLTAVVLSKGFYLTVLRGHFGNLFFWQKNIRYRFAHQVRGNLSSEKNGDIIFRMYNQFLKFPPFVLSITNPWTIPVFYFTLFGNPQNFLLERFMWWVLFSYILALSTIWIPGLRFLGEGQRYLELSAFPAAYLSASVLLNFTDSPYRLLAYVLYTGAGIASFITIIVIQYKAIIREKLRTITPDLEKMFRFLKKRKRKPRILCIPHQLTTNTIYHTGCPVFVNADYTDIRKIEDVYPYIRKPTPVIMKKYRLDLILLNEEYATTKDLKLKKYSIKKRFNNIVLLSNVS